MTTLAANAWGNTDTAAPRPWAQPWQLPLLVLLVLAPLPLGCATAGMRAGLMLGIAALALPLAFLGWRNREHTTSLPAGWQYLVPLLALPLLQLLPFGAGTVPSWFAAEHHATPSLVPVRTWTRAVEWWALALLSWTCFRAFHSLTSSRRACGALVLMAAAATIHAWLMAEGTLPLVDDQQTRTVWVGSFVNRNHFAHVLAVAALLGLGLFGAERHRRQQPALLLLLAVGIALAVVGILGSHSRGGLLALAGGTIAFTLLGPRWPLHHRWLVALTIAGLGTVVALLLPWGVAERFARISSELHSEGSRPDLWRGAVLLWRDSPWLGTGLGTYGDVSPATQSPAVPGRVEHAHSEPLELLAETGLLGVAAALLALAGLALPWLRRCLQLQDRQRRCLAAGCLAALLATAGHSLVEFPLQIPANAAWVAATAGLTASLLRRGSDPTNSRSAAFALLALAAVVLVAATHRTLRHEHADGLADLARGQQLLATAPAAAAAAAEAALQRNALSPRAHRLRGSALLHADNAAAAQAFAACLQWTNPAERNALQLELAIECLGAGELNLASQLLQQLLPPLPSAARRAALDQLYAAAPACELLLPLLPPDRAVLDDLAEVLLQRRDFAGRELVYKQLRPDQPAQLTMASDLLLQTAAITLVTEGETTVADFELWFTACPADADVAARPMALRIEGPGAAIFRPFDAAPGRVHYRAQLDASCPPGSYRVALDFRADAPHAVLGEIALAAAALPLPPGAAIAATRLHWATAIADRRQRPAEGLPLRDGDQAFRHLLIPAGDTDLVLRTLRATRLRVYLDGRELTPALAQPSTVHRYPLPAGGNGLLQVQAAGPDQPILRDLRCTERNRQ